jgi:hypothetical protein
VQTDEILEATGVITPGGPYKGFGVMVNYHDVLRTLFFKSGQ